MKKNKGFTVVELLASFALTMVVCLFLFEVLIEVKDIFIETALKTSIQERLSIVAKNIKSAVNGELSTSAATTLKKLNGVSGVYKDEDSRGRTIYRYQGANPNNYISFSGSLWRIMSIEANGSLKIIKDDNIGFKAFDSNNLRDSGSNGAGGTYCSQSTIGCNAWVSTSNMVGNPSTFVNGDKTGTVLLDSEMKQFLNEEYYRGLSNQEFIEEGTFNIGGAEAGDQISSLVEKEKKYQWKGYVGLATTSEYKKAEKDGNYLKKNFAWWLITPKENLNSDILNVTKEGTITNNGVCRGQCNNSLDKAVRPVLHITPAVNIEGEGLPNEPYTLNQNVNSSVSCLDNTCSINNINGNYEIKRDDNTIQVAGQKFKFPEDVIIKSYSASSKCDDNSSNCYLKLNLVLQSKYLSKDYKSNMLFYYIKY